MLKGRLATPISHFALLMELRDASILDLAEEAGCSAGVIKKMRSGIPVRHYIQDAVMEALVMRSFHRSPQGGRLHG